MIKYKVYCDKAKAEVYVEECFNCKYYEGHYEDDEGIIELIECGYMESMLEVKKEKN